MCRQKGRNEDEAKQKEALVDHQIPKDATVCDLGSGQGLTSVFLVKEYGFKVIAADLWSDPEENRKFFRTMGLTDEQIVPVKADAEALPFEKEFFDAVVSTDSYNYFGCDPDYLDQKLLSAGKYDFVPRRKNMQALAQHGLTIADAKNEILGLLSVITTKALSRISIQIVLATYGNSRRTLMECSFT